MFPLSVRKIIKQLVQKGYQAYIVGGGIRDALFNKTPKDFDVVTDASPEAIKGIFGNKCRLVGRRFRLAHVRVGKDIIEVATFRAHYNGHSTQISTELKSAQPCLSQHGLVMRDNVYGSLEEDAHRRDFTVNAIYYDPIQEELKDFNAGLQDLQAGFLRPIGSPEERYREDPVRMLRAIRLSVKLGLQIESEAENAIAHMGYLLVQVSPARLFDEVLKLFFSGYAVRCFQRLIDHGLLRYLLPLTWKCWQTQEAAKKLLMQTMLNTDERIHIGKSVTPAFLFAAFLWYPVINLQQLKVANRVPLGLALQEAVTEVLDHQMPLISIPKRVSRPMIEIWELQFKLAKRKKGHVFKTLGHNKFRAGYDLLLLREEAGELVPGLGKWWTDFQAVNQVKQKVMIESLYSKNSVSKGR